MLDQAEVAEAQDISSEKKVDFVSPPVQQVVEDKPGSGVGDILAKARDGEKIEEIRDGLSREQPIWQVEEEHQTVRREFLYHGTDREIEGDLQVGPQDRNIGGKAFYVSPDPEYANDYTYMMVGLEGHNKQHEAAPNMLRMELKPGTKILNLNDAPSEEFVNTLFQYAYNKKPELFKDKEDLALQIDREMGDIEDWEKEKYRFDDLLYKLDINFNDDRKLFADMGYSGTRITRAHLRPYLLSEVAVWDSNLLENAISAKEIPPMGPDEGITPEAEDILKAVDQKRGTPTSTILRIAKDSGVQIPAGVSENYEKYSGSLMNEDINTMIGLLREKKAAATKTTIRSPLAPSTV